MDIIRFQESKTVQYWNEYYRKESSMGGSYFCKQLPTLSHAIIGDIVLVYSNLHKIAYMEVFDWNEKTIHSMKLTGTDEFWGFSGFGKIDAFKGNSDCITKVGEDLIRKWE